VKQELPQRADVVIVGGGVVGVSIAYHLAAKGVRDVLLLERGMMGEGSTGKCAGGIRTQFSTAVNLDFSILSRAAFDRFEQTFGVDPEFHQVGYLFLAAAPREWSVFEANARLLGSRGLAVELLGPQDLSDRWPFLRVDDLMGGSLTPGDGFAGPYEVMQGFIKGARGLGAVLREGVEVTGVETSQGRVRGVATASGERVRADVVVNAAGPYAALVGAMAGLELPVKPIRRQIFFTDPFDDLPPQFPMVIDLHHGWYMRREGKGLLLAGPQDAKPSFNQGVDFDAKEWTAERSLHRVPVLARAAIGRGWAGLYEISPDHHAIMGEFPELKGFICVNGFSGHGFQHSPAAGLLTAELIVQGRATTVDLHPLRPTRFREGELIHEPLTAFKD
jgi:sarcosine oxidase subunit beta